MEEENSLISAAPTCFLDFLVMGCGRSSSSENWRLLGSKSIPGIRESSSSTSLKVLGGGCGRLAERFRRPVCWASIIAALVTLALTKSELSDAVGMASRADEQDDDDCTLSQSS